MARNLKLSTSSTALPVDVERDVLIPLFPVVHHQLLILTDVEGEVVVQTPHCQVIDLLLEGCVIVASHLSKSVGLVEAWTSGTFYHSS